MATMKFGHWKHLVGMEVEVRLGPTSTVSGTVDQAMQDSSIMWLTPRGEERRIIEKSQGHEVWIDPDKMRTTEQAELWVHAQRATSYQFPNGRTMYL